MLKPFFFFFLLSFPLKNLIKESWTPEWERDMASPMERLWNRKENGGRRVEGQWSARDQYLLRERERERRD